MSENGALISLLCQLTPYVLVVGVIKVLENY